MHREDRARNEQDANACLEDIGCCEDSLSTTTTTGFGVRPFSGWDGRIEEVRSFLDGDVGDVGLALDAATYLVMSHYHIGPSELHRLSPGGFSQMFAWATAIEQVKGEQMEEALNDTSSSSGGESLKVSSTSMNKMPFSE